MFDIFDNNNKSTKDSDEEMDMEMMMAKGREIIEQEYDRRRKEAEEQGVPDFPSAMTDILVSARVSEFILQAMMDAENMNRADTMPYRMVTSQSAKDAAGIIPVIGVLVGLATALAMSADPRLTVVPPEKLIPSIAMLGVLTSRSFEPDDLAKLAMEELKSLQDDSVKVKRAAAVSIAAAEELLNSMLRYHAGDGEDQEGE